MSMSYVKTAVKQTKMDSSSSEESENFNSSCENDTNISNYNTQTNITNGRNNIVYKLFNREVSSYNIFVTNTREQLLFLF